MSVGSMFDNVALPNGGFSRHRTGLIPRIVNPSQSGGTGDILHSIRDGENLPGVNGGGFTWATPRGEGGPGSRIQGREGCPGRDHKGRSSLTDSFCRAVEGGFGLVGKVVGNSLALGEQVTKMLHEMNGEELAEVLREMADHVQATVTANETVVAKLRQAALELESKRGS